MHFYFSDPQNALSGPGFYPLQQIRLPNIDPRVTFHVTCRCHLATFANSSLVACDFILLPSQTPSPDVVRSAINRENARDLLSHLLSVLSSPPLGYERYKKLYDDSPTPRRQGRDLVAIRDLRFTSIRTEVFDIFSAPGLKPKMDK